MFELDRTFSQYSAETGLTEWYFNAREGVYGPYRTKQRALDELKIFIEHQKRLGNDGGRTSNKKAKLTIMPLEFSLEPLDINYKDKQLD